MATTDASAVVTRVPILVAVEEAFAAVATQQRNEGKQP